MHTTIRRSDTLTDAESQQLFKWGEDIFETTHLGLTWRPKDLHCFLDADGRPASHAALLRHVISVNGQDATVAGLGGVVTLPWAERQGHARTVVTHAMDVVVNEWDVDGALLFCIPRRVSYYARMGWELVDGPVFVEQQHSRIASPIPVMTLPLTDRLRARSISRIDLDSLPW